ncbi:MAG: hypothetical protein Q8O67_20705 [Deltaproteobacteria bacterium]|nr:hypothetical protein [Deltaproteobacteria bacterium]
MSLLVLSDDELALLRFTCDLFFVDESPLHSVDQQAREPEDYAGSYAALVERGIIDPHGFRITDDALNRIAPVTECDARLVHLIVNDDGTVTQEDHWLLDEIAVVYERQTTAKGEHHLFGPDLDSTELVARLGRRLLPRRAEGERFDVVLSASELLSTSLLLAAADIVGRRALSEEEARAALSSVPADDTVLPAAAPAHLSGHLLAVGKKKDPHRLETTLKALVDKKVLLRDALGLRLSSSLYSLRGFASRRRHTLVRTDFRDDDWLVREVTLLPVEGSLFVIAPARGGFRIAELDGESLRAVLHDATGPQTAPEKKPPQRLAALLQSRRV